MSKVTESESRYSDIDKMDVKTILESINGEDKTVANAVAKTLPQIEKLVVEVVERINKGGRLFYIGAGTSGRLGIVDASECPPTFGVPFGLVVGIIAGGDSAIRKAVEFAEDDFNQAIKDLDDYLINENDTVVGIAASGSTPYVVGGLKNCNAKNILTSCITCNPESEVAKIAKIPIVAVTGPEFITGSTRMKSGTAQKLILNMISTSVMVKLGRVKGNRMVDMQLSNNKLIDRGTKMIMDELNVSYEKANELLKIYQSVRKAIDAKK